jgi:acetyl-CoA carboxylase biotin carboxylase subunit
MITGFDLIKEQIRVAAGEPLGYTQDAIQINGHAIECRINAENPMSNFMPAPGTISVFMPPGGYGVRVDSAIYPGYTIPMFYDSMVGKLIVWGKNREEAIDRMQRALKEFVVEGVPTTIPFHLLVLDNPFFRKGEVYTNFIQLHMSDEPVAKQLDKIGYKKAGLPGGIVPQAPVAQAAPVKPGEVSPEVAAAIAAALKVISMQHGATYAVRSIQRAERHQSHWRLSGWNDLMISRVL